MIVPCADGVAQAGSWCIEHSVDHLFERKHQRCQASTLIDGHRCQSPCAVLRPLRCFFTGPNNLKPRMERLDSNPFRGCFSIVVSQLPRGDERRRCRNYPLRWAHGLLIITLSEGRGLLFSDSARSVKRRDQRRILGPQPCEG